MASIDVQVRTPKVPNFVFLELPGAERGVKVPISQLTVADVEKLGEAWTADLIARRAEMIRTGGAVTDEEA